MLYPSDNEWQIPTQPLHDCGWLMKAKKEPTMKSELQIAIERVITIAERQGGERAVREFIRGLNPSAKPAKKVARIAQPKAAKAAKVPKAMAAKSPKRSADEMEALTGGITEHLRHHPGASMEQIGKAIGRATRELALPVKKLIAWGTIRTEGQKRATKYFPAVKSSNGISAEAVS